MIKVFNGVIDQGAENNRLPRAVKDMEDKKSSFLTFAERFFRLGGGFLVEEDSPYFVPTDALEDKSGEWAEGYLSMAHYDYLGLMHHPEATAAAKAAIDRHGTGVLGPTGRGLCEHFGIDPERVELSIGTLSKSFASAGGFVAGNKKVIEWMRFGIAGFIYSVGLQPATVASSHQALKILRAEPDRVTRLRRNSKLFLRKAREAGLNTGTAIGEAVVPVLFESPMECVQVAKALMDQGIYAPPVIQIGIPKDLPRIRFFLSATHTEADIDRVIDALVAASGGSHAVRNRLSAE